MSLEIDDETIEMLGFQCASWVDMIQKLDELRAARVVRNNERTKVVRPTKCPACGKVLKQDLEGRVRHYCNRKCQRAAKRADRKCACGKALNKALKWCSDRCRNRHRLAAARGEPICKCGKPLPKGSRVWCSQRCRKSQPEFKERFNRNRKLGRQRKKGLT